MTAAVLVDFILERLADDEERALYVQREQASGWGPETFESWRLSWHDEYDLLCLEPSRALLEVACKRSLVEVHRQSPNGRHPDYCRVCDGLQGWPCPTLRHVAAIYADHPDYRDEWKP